MSLQKYYSIICLCVSMLILPSKLDATIIEIDPVLQNYFLWIKKNLYESNETGYLQDEGCFVSNLKNRDGWLIIFGIKRNCYEQLSVNDLNIINNTNQYDDNAAELKEIWERIIKEKQPENQLKISGGLYKSTILFKKVFYNGDKEKWRQDMDSMAQTLINRNKNYSGLSSVLSKDEIKMILEIGQYTSEYYGKNFEVKLSDTEVPEPLRVLLEKLIHSLLPKDQSRVINNEAK